MAERGRTDNTMAERRRTENTMAKRRRDNTMAERSRTDNTMAERRREDNTMAERRREDNTMAERRRTRGQTMIYNHYTEHLRLNYTNPTKNGDKCRCFGKVSYSCPTSGTRITTSYYPVSSNCCILSMTSLLCLL